MGAYVCAHGVEDVLVEQRISGNVDIGTFLVSSVEARGHEFDLDHRAPRRGRCPAWGACGTGWPKQPKAVQACSLSS